MPRKVFTEIGIDPDNNKYLFGISTEIENEDGTEIRKNGFVKMKLQGFYFRIWLLKIVVGFGIPSGFVVKKKNRNNFKLLFGLSGINYEKK
jgi:hypothetical protein